MNIFAMIGYLRNFLFDQSFQERQGWVRWLTKKLAIIPPNVWTISRVFGGWATIRLFGWQHPWLALICFLLFALTDWVDGKVARFLKPNGTTADGSLLDSTADKFFVLPVLVWWGRGYVPSIMLVALILIEVFGNVFLGVLYGLKGFLANSKNAFEHVLAGKIKFTLQVVLACLLWLALYIDANLIWWQLGMTVILGVIIILAAFSVVCKINPRYIRWLPDCLTAGNILCGLYAMKFAGSNVQLAAALIIIASFFDFFDGMAARKFREKGSKFGAVADDIGDFISFACAPAYLLYCSGVHWGFCIGYTCLTAIRLIYFIFTSSGDGIFRGVPSTAVAVCLASLILWGGGMKYLLPLMIVCGCAEVLFFLKWYHCRHFSRLSGWIKSVIVSLVILALCVKGFGFTFLCLSAGYVVFFFKPLADRLWCCNKNNSNTQILLDLKQPTQGEKHEVGDS